MNHPTSDDRPAPLAFGPFVLDAAEARLTRDGEPVALVGRPLQVLEALSQRAGRLVGKDELLDLVWGHRHVTESVLKVAINALRGALGDDAKAPRFVETVPRRGFRFVAEVRPLARGAALAAAPVASSAAPPPRASGNLPPPRPGLVGRLPDREQLLQLLHEHRLVTLTGLGGMGKTRLAMDVGGTEPPPDGAWLVRLDVLSPLADNAAARAELLTVMAGPLPVPPSAAGSAESLGRALGPLSLRLVLDNAEHVAAPLAAVLPVLLAAAPQLHVLVTSQRPLRLADEQVMPLAPLALPPRGGTAAEDTAPPPDPTSYASGRLLCERLARAMPGWHAQAADHASIAAICRRLEGVPLALELAAARVPLLGLAGVQERLAAPLSVLTRNSSDSPERHRSLGAALGWTFSLLDVAERQALAQLAVFVGAFALEAAEQVLQPLLGHAALDVLQNLQDHSLLVVEPTPAGPRLRLYDSVRQQALAELEASGQATAARRRHAAWAEARALALESLEFRTPQLHWLPLARADLDNLRAALHFGLATPGDEAGAARTAQALVMVWVRMGLFSEAMQWLGRLRDASVQARLPGTLPLELDRAWGMLAPYAQNIDPRAALATLQASHGPLAQVGPPSRLYLAQNAESILHFRLGQPDAHRAATQRTRALIQPGWQLMETRHVRWQDLMSMRAEGDLSRYEAECRRLSAELLAQDARAETWAARNGLGQAALATGRVEQACGELRTLVDDIAAAGCLHEQAPAVAMAACAHLRQDASPATRALARQALRLLQAQDMAWWMADALPWAAWHQGRADDARRLQAWADALVATRQDRRGPVFSRLRQDFLERAGADTLPVIHGLDEAGALALALPAP